MEITGIYQVKSKADPEKALLIKAVDIAAKWNINLLLLNAKKHENKRLQDHFNLFGEDDFEISLLQECNKFQWDQVLQDLIKETKPFFNVIVKKTNKKNED